MENLQHRLVMVVDDDAAMLRALGKVLRVEGAKVKCAADATEALDVLTRREERIDLVVTDLRMPYLTGVTLVYAIREIFPALPVIVLTAFGSPDVKTECLRQGAAAFLEKPLNTTQLLETIHNVLAHRALGRGATPEPDPKEGKPHTH